MKLLLLLAMACACDDLIAAEPDHVTPAAIAIAPGPQVTPAQRSLALASATRDRDALRSQLADAMRDHRPESEITALQCGVAQYEGQVVGMTYATMCTELVGATLANDIKRFHAWCTDSMISAITAEDLAAVAKSMNAGIPTGQYVIIPGGSMRRAQQDVLVYIIRPIGGGDDTLALMSVLDGKCSGFVLR